MLKGRVRFAFSVAGRGTAVGLETALEGSVRNGDRVLIVLEGGAKVLTVRAVEAVDGIDGDWNVSAVALLFDSLDPKQVIVGAEIVSAD